MGERMTKEEVLALVKATLDEAKKGIESMEGNLMIGRAPWRCLSCDQSGSFHSKLAPKVIHQALPSSGYLSRSSLNPEPTPATASNQGDEKVRALRPVKLGFGLGRPKSNSKAGTRHRSATFTEGTMKRTGST